MNAPGGFDIRKGIPSKMCLARRRTALPVGHFPSGYEVAIQAVSVFHLSQLSDVDLEVAYRSWIRPAEAMRGNIEKSYRAAVSSVVLADKMPGSAG
jgi:hypothetical protein